MGLFGSNILEFALSVIFIYLLVAMIASAIAEWISSLLNVRANQLKKGVEELFTPPTEMTGFLQRKSVEDSNVPATAADRARQEEEDRARMLATAVFTHPLIQTPRDARLLAYIPSRTFALALLDTLTKEKADPGSFVAIREALVKGESELVRRALLPLIDASEGKVDRAREAVAQWFDEAMGYVSAQYKQYIQRWLFAIGFLMAIAMNIDSVHLYQRLWNDAPLRAAMAGAGTRLAGESLPDFEKVRGEAGKVGLPIGWEGRDYWKAKPKTSDASASDGTDNQPKPEKSLLDALWNDVDYPKFLLALAGWLITALAAAMGAPFWFDVLNKFVNLRAGGKRPEPAALPDVRRADTTSNAPVKERAVDQNTQVPPAEGQGTNPEIESQGETDEEPA